MSPELSTARVQRYFDAHAGSYDQQMGVAERWLLGRHRKWARPELPAWCWSWRSGPA